MKHKIYELDNRDGYPKSGCKAMFMVGDPEYVHEAYQNDEYWNGYDIPFFTREQADRFMDAQDALYDVIGDDIDYVLPWDDEDGVRVYVFITYGGETTEYYYPIRLTVPVDGNEIVYQLGNGFCWSDTSRFDYED